jgi:hypothetical protein
MRSRFAAVLLLAAFAAGCALRTPRIGEIKQNPGRYEDRTVAVTGIVTSSWSIPLVPYKFYKVDDGTGELTVLANSGRTPTKGARVRVKGKLSGIGTFGGNAIGLHLRQTGIDIKRY